MGVFSLEIEDQNLVEEVVLVGLEEGDGEGFEVGKNGEQFLSSLVQFTYRCFDPEQVLFLLDFL